MSFTKFSVISFLLTKPKHHWMFWLFRYAIREIAPILNVSLKKHETFNPKIDEI